MGFLTWLGGIVILFWLLGLIFKIGGKFLKVLLIIAVIAFIIDLIS